MGDIIAPKYKHPWTGKGGAQGNAMRYISGIKILTGENLDQKGEIRLYQFDITLDNIVDMMLNSVRPGIVSMPIALVRGGDDIASRIPKAGEIPSNQELEEEVINTVKRELDRIEVPGIMQKIDPEFSLDRFVDDAFKTMEYSSGKPSDKTKGLWAVGGAIPKFKSKLKAANFIKNEVFLPKYRMNSELESIYNPPKGPGSRLTKNAAKASQNAIDAFIKELGAVITLAHDTMVTRYSSSAVANVRAAEVNKVEWLNVKPRSAAKAKQNAEHTSQMYANQEETSKYYNSLTPEGKIRALQNTRGMLAGDKTQWILNKTQATNESYPVEAKYLGELRIGGAYVEQMLTQVSGILNQEIFAVFSSLKSLSDNLNGFFSGGLADNQKAVTAIESAQDIEQKTTELKSEK